MYRTRKFFSLLLAILMIASTLAPLAYAEPGDLLLSEGKQQEEETPAPEEEEPPGETPVAPEPEEAQEPEDVKEPEEAPIPDEVEEAESEEQSITGEEAPLADEKTLDEPGGKDIENEIIPMKIISPVEDTHTYRFYVGDNVPENVVDTQIIKNNESLKEPQTPVLENKKFIRWYRVVGEDKVTIDFNEPIEVDANDPPQNVDIEVFAEFEDVVYVYFVNTENDEDKVIATKEVIPGQKTDDNEVPLVITEPGKAFSHWSTEKSGPEFDFANTEINQDTTLYTVLDDRWTVSFDSQGGRKFSQCMLFLETIFRVI